MKFALLFFFILFHLFSFGQYGHRFLPEFFNAIQPNAPAEAMGKAYVSIDGDVGSINYNPAGLASIEEMQVYGSLIPSGNYRPEKTFSFFGFNYKVFPFLNVGFSQTLLDYDLRNYNSNISGKYYRKKYTLTLSSEPIKNLLIGVNTNYFSWSEGYGPNANPFYFDLGAIKKFLLINKNKYYYFNIGASITNFTGASTANESLGIVQKLNLPIISRYGVSFKTQFGSNKIFDSGSALSLVLQSDYKLLLNSKYQAGIKVGGQITIIDLISLRAGYSEENSDRYNLPEYNKRILKSFTYGVGLQIPLNTVTKIPLKIFFDYCRFPELNASYILPDGPDRSVYTLRIDYHKSKK